MGVHDDEEIVMPKGANANSTCMPTTYGIDGS